ncbi:unnamed protein product [Bursaphelenchus xylophilus]|uniref:(pine wood nematode) hypothetical protein n=1 Tax=Bursaphelenchus xylophilus TaxID=6326 RepID=A0A1I7S9L5_BURXY|nr:unnamed protein product [Bursaphelenchus xylophilus]CAG9131942.1 unnamed protein product [Bursaphelenchus xylophilus]
MQGPVDLQQRRRKVQHLQMVMENIGQLELIHNGYRALAPHFAGGFDEERVFGGHILAQFYLAAKQLRDDAAIHRIDVNFLAAASTETPINYEKVNERGDLIWFEATQQNRLVDKSIVKFKSIPSTRPRRPAPQNPPIKEFLDLPAPNSCPLMEDALRSEVIDENLQTTGPGYDFMFSRQSRDLFEVRFINPTHLKSARGPIKNYMRLRKELRDVPINDPMVVPLLISDYFACLPVTVLTEKLLIPIDSVASLNHKVMIHTEKCDPNGWFILELDYEAASSTGLVLGRVAAEDGTPILNFSQQFYLQLDERPKL